MNSYKDRVRLVIKNDPSPYRDHSRLAAEASLAARDQGRYWEMHDLLLARSPMLDRTNLIGYAKELGLDAGRFAASIDGHRHDAEIERDKQLAAGMGIDRTPTFFINGRKLVGDWPFEYFRKIIEEELGRGK